MTSPFSAAKSYVLTAGSTSVADIMTALHTHFSAGAGNWRLKAGVGNSADGFIIEPKTPVTANGHTYNTGISIRRNGTTDWRIALDEGNAYTAAGNSSGGPSGASGNAIGEITASTSGIASAKIAVSELLDCVFVVFFNSGLTVTQQGWMLGRAFDGANGGLNTAPLLNKGNAVCVGVPHIQSSGWIGTSGASRMRSNGGSRSVYAVNTNQYNNPIPDAPAASKEIITPLFCGVYHDASSNYTDCLMTRYLRLAGTLRVARAKFENLTLDECWMHINDPVFTLGGSKAVIPWEQGVAAPA